MVAVDLRDDWPKALCDSGFRPCPAHGVDRRGPADVPASRGPGPPVRQHHRAVGAGAGSPPNSTAATMAQNSPNVPGPSPAPGRARVSTSTSPNCSTTANAINVVDYLAEQGLAGAHTRDRREMFTDYGRMAIPTRRTRRHHPTRCSSRWPSPRSAPRRQNDPNRWRQLGSGVQRGRHRDVGGSVPGAGHPPARPLISDPYADGLVKAVGLDLCNRIADGELDFGADELLDRQQMCSRSRSGTRFFDDFFRDAVGAAGIRQAVILASRARHPRLSPVLAGRDRGLRDRPAAGAGIKGPHPGATGCHPGRRPAHDTGGPA